MRYEYLRYFKTEQDAEKFARKVGSDSCGFETDVETGAIKWYVEYNEEV